ncbi:MAG TPA: hypothetical protein VIS07_09545 [Candidatus Binatia bacterium]
MAAYAKALEELYRSRPQDFVAARKRLAADLRQAGERDAAARLAKRRRPPASAWAVNQLYWRQRKAFDSVLDAAAKLRDGDVGAAKDYRRGLGELRRRAEELLREVGLGASDATLRRVSATLAAIAAAGGFDPDPPGALEDDRDAPGFDALTLAAGDDGGAARSKPARETEKRERATAHGRSAAEPVGRAPERDKRDAAREKRDAEREQRRAERAERKRLAAERKRRDAERRRLRAELRSAADDVRKKEKVAEQLRDELRRAEEALAAARSAAEDLERRLDDLEQENERPPVDSRDGAR